MDRTNCNTVICCYTNVKDRDVIDKVEEAAKRHPVKNIIVTHTRDFSSSPPAHEKEEGVVWFTDLIEKYPPAPPKVDIDVKKDIAILFFTGGTTGRPKGVMLSHYNYVAQTESLFPSMLPRFLSMPLSYIGGLGGIIRCLMPLPMFHVYGRGESILVIHYGITLLCVTDPRDTKEFVRLAKKYHPLLVIGAPTQYMKLLKEEGAENLGMISLSGSMALAPEVHKAYEKKSRTIMAEGYGLSEFAPVTHVPSMTGVLAPIFGSRENVGKIMGFLNGIIERPEISSIIKSSAPILSSILGLLGSIRPIPDLVGTIGNRVITLLSDMVTSPAGRTKELTGSIGQLVSGVKMKIVDEDTGETIPMEKVVKEGLRGEMCLDAPFKMLGYWPEVGSGMDEEGYVHTGDIVKVDDWGLTYIVDRTKDMVNISGYKVYTREIDDLLYEIPGVDEAATVGISDPELWFGALSQVAFSLGLGMGAMIAYASYLPKDSKINTNAMIVSLADTGTAFLAGFSVFSSAGFLAYSLGVPFEEITVSSIPLIFITIPTAVSMMPIVPQFFGILFFFSLWLLALTSTYSLTQTFVTGLEDKYGISKKKATAIACIISLVVGLLVFTRGFGLYWI